MVLTAYAALFPATNSFCHRRPRTPAQRNPVGLRSTSTNLTPATGARTTRFCRTPLRRSSTRQMTAHRLPCPTIASRDDAATSTASHPNVRDDRDTPPRGGWDGGNREVIWVERKSEYFSDVVWTGQISLIPLDKLAPPRDGFRASLRSLWAW